MKSKRTKAKLLAVCAVILIAAGFLSLEYITKLEQNPNKNFTTLSILGSCVLVILGFALLIYSYKLYKKALLKIKKKKSTKVVFLAKDKKKSQD